MRFPRVSSFFTTYLLVPARCSQSSFRCEHHITHVEGEAPEAGCVLHLDAIDKDASMILEKPLKIRGLYKCHVAPLTIKREFRKIIISEGQILQKHRRSSKDRSSEVLWACRGHCMLVFFLTACMYVYTPLSAHSQLIPQKDATELPALDTYLRVPHAS